MRPASEGVTVLDFADRVRTAIKLAGDRILVIATPDKLHRILDRAHQAHG